jgi:hypothetical protein
MLVRFLVTFSALLIFLSANVLSAQEAGSDFLAKAAKIPDLTAKVEKDSFAAPACPKKARVDYVVNYPGGTGSMISDLILENHADYVLAKYLEDLKDFLGQEWGCELGDKDVVALTHKTDYQATKPSPGYLSVLFTQFSDTGGANPNEVYAAFNFKPKGLLLTLADLFEDPDTSLPKFWAYVYEKSCASSGKDVLPSFYGDAVSCGQKTAPSGDDFIKNVDTVESLGNLFFSSLGATINLEAYDAFDGASGPYRLDIPKEDFIAIGANPAIWESK